MKKLMIAAAVMAAGVAMADGIVSSDVVGYQTKTVTTGFSLQTPTFTDVGVDGYDLANFKFVNGAGDGTEVIQVLDANGVNNETWAWLNGNVGMPDGWYDSVSWEPIAATIVPGDGYLMNVSADVDMQFAGQVKNGKTTVTVPTGFFVAGNCTPMPISIQSLKLVNAAGDGTEVIQVLDENGVNNVTWAWLNGNVGMADGWYDSVTWESIDATIAPGEAFLMNVSADVDMEVPSVL